jgi:hypothetical protein
VAWAALAVAGCATTSGPVEPSPNPLLATPIVPELPPGGPPVADGRARFRQVFCAELQAHPQAAAGRPCEDWLWRLPDESDRPAGADLAVRPPVPTADIVLVPGAFGECYGEEAWPFADGAKQLVDRGYYVHRLMVGGRSGTEANAKQIAAALASLEFTPGRKVVMIGFSKGSNDILRFLVDFPDLAERIDAVVSVGSPVLGTPAADLAAGTYDTLLKKLPLDACPPGDGQVIESLRPATRAAWMAAHTLPSAIRYYSLAGFAGRDRIANMLVPSWKYLGEFDKRNDGQVIASMAVIPGATLLGYVNADHWGLAMHNERRHPHLVKRVDAVPFPTDALLSALVEFVELELNTPAAAR